MIDMQIGLLFDFYGQFLTQKQRDIMHLYFENDYSLSEIAENLHISRQAVHDTIKKSKRVLYEYEMRLGLAQKFAGKDLAITRIAGIAAELAQLIEARREKREEDAYLLQKLEEIGQIIQSIQGAEGFPEKDGI